MIQIFHRIVAGVIVLLLLAALAMPAFSQSQSSWLPNFDRNTHVYVDPALKNHPSYPVDFSGMSSEIRKLSGSHKLEVYVVATERSFDPNRKIAIEIADDLVARWSGRSDFPRDDYLVIVWVRQASDPNKGSVAAYAGNKLQGYGFNASRMSDRVNGPVTPALKQFMPRDPEQALLQVVRNVNNGVDSTIAARQQAERDRIARAEQAERDRIARAEQAERDRIESAQRAERDRIEAERRAVENAERARQMQTIAMYGIPSALVIGLLLFLTLRFRRARARASEVLEKSRAELQNAGHWYVQLEEAYLGFLKRQENWQKRFDPKGRTAKQFSEAVRWYAELTTRKLAAADMFARAEAAFNSARWPISSGFEKAIAILTVEEITVSEKNLSIEEAELFKGLVLETKYAPAELLADMEALFSKTNKALAEIKKAFEGAAQNRQDIAALLSAVEELKGKLSEVGLSFEPYKDRFARISADRDAILALIDKDPLAAFSGSEEVEKEAGVLKSEIEHAIKLAGSMVEAEKQWKAACDRIAEVRAQTCVFAYPEGKSDKAEENFLLQESGANPDEPAAESRRLLDEAISALKQGKLALAEEKKTASGISAAEAIAIVNEVIEAKAYVEKQVNAVRNNLARLQAELPPAGKQVDTLKADYLAKNYAGEPEKFESATSVSNKTEAELAKTRKAYFEQSFVGARRLLANVGSEIQASREKLVEIATKLKYLNERRDYARQAVHYCGEFASGLKGLLEKTAFTSSKNTEESYKRLLPVLAAQKTDVAKQVTDWPAACEAAEKLANDFKRIAAAIEDEKKAYEIAGSRIEAVRAAVNSAASVVAQADTRNAARRKLEEARQVLSQLESEYKVARSDWNALARKAETQKNVASEAQKLAETDQRLAREARSQISEVESRIRALAVRSFVQTVSWGGYSQVVSLGTVLDLSEANRYAGEASGNLRNRDYEGAIEAARRADKAADSAESWANAQLALMAQELISRWQAEERRKEEERRQREEEERRRREEEERRQREEDERRRRDDNNSGGGNYGGGGSGGDNYGGGGSTGSGGDNY